MFLVYLVLVMCVLWMKVCRCVMSVFMIFFSCVFLYVEKCVMMVLVMLCLVMFCIVLVQFQDLLCGKECLVLVLLYLVLQVLFEEYCYDDGQVVEVQQVLVVVVVEGFVECLEDQCVDDWFFDVVYVVDYYYEDCEG